MKYVAMILMAMFCSTAVAGEIKTSPNGVVYSEGQVYELPQDEGLLFVTVYGQPGNSKYEQVKKWFNDNPHLRSIRSQVHFAAVDSNTAMYRERYASVAPVLPSIQLAFPSGKLAYEVRGNAIPASAEALANSLNTELRRCRPQPAPSPEPAPIDNPPIIAPPVVTPVAPSYPWWILWITAPVCAAIGVGVGAVRTMRREYGWK